MTALKRFTFAWILLPLAFAAPSAFGSCVCPRVDPEEVVKHATTIAVVRVTRAEIARQGCFQGASTCGIDAAGTIDYIRGTGPDRFEKRITNTDPYFCGFSLRAGDELLDIDGLAPSLGTMTSICVLYDTLRNRPRIEQYLAIAKRQQ
jgi:hypothetical protein